MLNYGLEMVYLSTYQPSVDIVCVHGYGAKPETTWHHDETGKTWIEDQDFLRQLDRNVRVLSFSYNGDLAANMLPPTVGFHACDLLECLEQALEKPISGNNLFFVAHGFGGLIVKRALQMCLTTPHFLKVRSKVAGVVFFGTPHAHTNSDALLRTVRESVALLGGKDTVIPDEEIRGCAATVGRINESFSKGKTIKALSYWETQPSTVNETGDSYETLIIPLDCQKKDLADNKDHEVDCSHTELPRFRSMFDPRFTSFKTEFISMMASAIAERTAQRPARIIIERFPTPPRSPYSSRSSSPSSVSVTPSVGETEDKPDTKDKKPPRRRSPRRPVPEDALRNWQRISRAKEEKQDRERFLRSLTGWSQGNHDADLRVAGGTCEWFKVNKIFNMWLTEPGCFSMFYLGRPGQGKSHLAKAISNHIRKTRPADVALRFHCIPGEDRPALWEYFTWRLIHDDDSWFERLPPRYNQYPEGSPPLTTNELVDLWGALQDRYANSTIYLIIDGLDQCGIDVFREHMAYFDQVRLRLNPARIPRPPWVRQWSPTVKVLFTCRQTDAAMAASSHASRCTIPPVNTQNDIGIFVDHAVAELRDKPEITKSIKDKAGVYWPYAKFAVEAVESSLPLRSSTVFTRDDYLPPGLERWYGSQVLPILQSVGNERSLRTAIILLASLEWPMFITIDQLEDAVRCLSGQEGVNLAEALQKQCSDIIHVRGKEPVAFMHRSLKEYMQRFFSGEQRIVNMISACLKYLMQDSFRKRLLLVWDNQEATKSWMATNVPFYNYAAVNWVNYLSQLKELDDSLKPLLREFFSAGSQQHKTWNHWRAWHYHEPEAAGLHDDPVVAPLLVGDCLHALEYLIPPPETPRLDSWTVKAKNILQRSLRREQDEGLIVPNWPNVANYRNGAAFILAAETGKMDMIRYFFRWPNFEINTRNPHGLTLLVEYISLPRHIRLPNVPLATWDATLVEICREMLLHGADPNIPTDFGITALHPACSSGNTALVLLLLDYGARLNAGDVYGCTPLEMACVSDKAELVDMLIRRGAEVNSWWSRGRAPLTRCILDGRLAAFRVLLSVADVNMMSEGGYAPIHVAAKKPDRLEFLRLLLTRPDLDLDVVSEGSRYRPTNRFENALAMAIENDNYDAVELLLQAGASPGPLPKLTAPPLFLAAREEQVAVVELLLAHRAPVNAFTDVWYQKTALAVAARDGHEDIAALLLQHGADPTTEDGYGAAGPLYAVLDAEGPQEPIFKLLLEAPIPVDVDFVPKDELHALVSAVRAQKVEITKLLLDQGLDTSIWLKPGQRASPLHEAADDGFLEGCEMLLQHEPRWVDAQFDEGNIFESPLHKACEGGHSKVVRLLLDRGARADLPSCHYRETPLMIACEKSDYETIKMVLEAAPESVNAVSYVGTTALSFAGEVCDLKVIELLLDAGADFRLRDSFGSSFVEGDLFEEDGSKRADKTIELLMRHGYDLNEVITSTGRTVLAFAIRSGTVRDVRWLLEHGADPLRCMRGPGLPEAWQTALQRAALSARPDMMELLMEERWGLREHLGHEDWTGMTVVPLLAASMQERQAVERLWVLCDEIGVDVSDLMRRPSISGLSPVDYAIGQSGVTATARPQLEQLVISRIDQLLHVQRTVDAHISLLHAVSLPLLHLGGYDAEAATIVKHILSLPLVRWDDDKYWVAAGATVGCHGCGENLYENARLCRLCDNVWCVDCDGVEDCMALHQHVWVDVPLTMDVDVASAEIQEVLEKVRRELMEAQSKGPEQTVCADDVTEVQTSLQLAVLDAFGYLAMRKPTWTPYLPLSAQAEDTIAVWAPMIQSRRQIIDRRNLNFEVSAERCFQEWCYFRRGLTRRYMDEELVQRDIILGGLGALFEEKEEERDETKSEHSDVSSSAGGDATIIVWD